MDIQQIEISLNSQDPQQRMRAVTALREYDAEVAVPLLKSRIEDPELLVRSFVAMGLGRKQNDLAFDALVKMLDDPDYNVRAEAASSMSLYGDRAIPYLRHLFREDGHWLLRQSILAVAIELFDPEALYDLCQVALKDADTVVRFMAIEILGTLANTPKQDDALEQLLPFVSDENWRVRSRVVLALRHFQQPQAQAALAYLKKDDDYRVTSAFLEMLLVDTAE
ncbi:MAG: HEAT repeat domain-containing protein [Cyanobacteria bacterium SID2]|nr:HEAT repeat domain-containing protein [Cyanobacteria bacterium SID2]MBP0002155.1 HEAT repeat domain-containing protein [Cyanobacteria bacterium SBC]